MTGLGKEKKNLKIEFLFVFRDTSFSSDDFSGVNPLELELLSRISGTRRDSRPIRIVANSRAPSQSDQRQSRPHNLNNAGIVFESTKTTTSISTTRRTTTSQLDSDTNPTSSSSKANTVESMRQLEIQRIRDERRKSLRKKQERENDKLQDAVAAANSAAATAAAEKRA